MAVKDIINAGVGFEPGTLAYVITRGLGMFLSVFIREKRELLVREKKRFTLFRTRERHALAQTKKRFLLK